MQALSLFELNNLVRQTLEMTMYDEYWVTAEISELRVNRHCYMEFVQKDSVGNGLVAKARGQIWQNKWYLLQSHFERTTGQPLSVGMQVLVKVQVTFHELYGYSLNVVDIDPTYTLGDIAKKRKEIINQLRAEGVENMNKELPLPRLLQRIAVISAAGAAGYGDFCDQLLNNDRGLAFHTRLFPAMMQGNGVEDSVIAALDAIADNIDLWDVVVIIRGGGATSDLSGFDTLALAENVAQFPIPIITGIGHERDDTIIDMVSHTRVKTPTAAAEFILHHAEEELGLVESLADAIIASTNAIIAEEKTRLQVATGKLPLLMSRFKIQEEAKLERRLNQMLYGINQSIQNRKNRTEMIEQQLNLHTKALTTKAANKLAMLETIIKNADPVRILRLGYSITRVNGKAVKEVSQLKSGDVIDTELANGTIKSTVK